MLRLILPDSCYLASYVAALCEGYAKAILGLALKKLTEQDVKRALITADENNIGSWKTIEACGGVLENEIPSIFHEGALTRRYWIDLV